MIVCGLECNSLHAALVMGDCTLCVMMYLVPTGCTHSMKACVGTYVPQDTMLMNDISSKPAAAIADCTSANDTRWCC